MAARKTSSILANLGIAAVAAILVFAVSQYLVKRDAAAAAVAVEVAKKEGFQVNNSFAVAGILIGGMILGVLVAVAGSSGVKMVMEMASRRRYTNAPGSANSSSQGNTSSTSY